MGKLQSSQQGNKLINTLSAIFHPLTRLFSWGADSQTEPETTVLHPGIRHDHVEIRPLIIQFGKSLNEHGTTYLAASHRPSDDGQTHIQLFIKVHTATTTGKFNRIALHVRLRDAVTDEPVEILGFSTPANSAESATTLRGKVSEQLEGDLLTYGKRNDVMQWVWQHDPEAEGHFGLSYCHFVEISTWATHLVKAEFRLVAHFQDSWGERKRSVPHKKGKFIEKYLRFSPEARIRTPHFLPRKRLFN